MVLARSLATAHLEEFDKWLMDVYSKEAARRVPAHWHSNPALQSETRRRRNTPPQCRHFARPGTNVNQSSRAEAKNRNSPFVWPSGAHDAAAHELGACSGDVSALSPKETCGVLEAKRRRRRGKRSRG